MQALAVPLHTACTMIGYVQLNLRKTRDMLQEQERKMGKYDEMGRRYKLKHCILLSIIDL